MRYFIISQPKSGTYLCGNLLSELGITNSLLHYKKTGYISFKDVPLEEAKMNNTGKRVRASYPDVLSDIPEESFALGHLQHNAKNVKYLKDFKKVLVKRDLSSALSSFNDFVAETNREYFDMRQLYNGVKGWKNEHNTFIITFDDMINKNIEKIDQLQEFLFGEIKHDSEQAITQALAKDSVTKSNKRKNGEIYK